MKNYFVLLNLRYSRRSQKRYWETLFFHQEVKTSLDSLTYHIAIILSHLHKAFRKNLTKDFHHRWNYLGMVLLYLQI